MSGPFYMKARTCSFGVAFLALAACEALSPSAGEDSRELVAAPTRQKETKRVSATVPLTSVSGENSKRLVRAEGWETVAAHCTACHSEELIIQQRADKETWKQIIRWMQDTQGLWTLEPPIEETILTYLARHYSPQRGSRRQPLNTSLMPPNPYGASAANHQDR
jgi:hypothetical protein